MLKLCILGKCILLQVNIPCKAVKKNDPRLIFLQSVLQGQSDLVSLWKQMNHEDNKLLSYVDNNLQHWSAASGMITLKQILLSFRTVVPSLLEYRHNKATTQDGWADYTMQQSTQHSDSLDHPFSSFSFFSTMPGTGWLPV